MGFYIRKSVRVGPLRFNLSKSGVGVSTGIKGFRVGFGPRGNYVHAGVKGIYYRQTLTPKQVKNGSAHENEPTLNVSIENEKKEIDSDLNLLFKESSEDQLVQEITQKIKKWNSWKWVAGLAVLGFISQNLYALSAGVLLTILAYLWDQTRKSVVIFYDFDESKKKAYESFVVQFENLLTVKKIWHIEAKRQIKDTKRNAGATQELSRKTTPVSMKPPKYLKTNVPIPTIGVGKQKLCFMPDKVLILSNSSVASVHYEDLTIEVGDTRFIESERLPSDAQVIDHTWEIVNKSGGPDKRFKNNRRLPICRYEMVHFTSSSGLNELVHLSRCGQFEPVKNIIKNFRFKTAS